MDLPVDIYMRIVLTFLIELFRQNNIPYIQYVGERVSRFHHNFMHSGIFINALKIIPCIWMEKYTHAPE